VCQVYFVYDLVYCSKAMHSVILSLSHGYLIFWVRTGLLEKAKSQVSVLKEQYKELAEVLGGSSGQYYR